MINATEEVNAFQEVNPFAAPTEAPPTTAAPTPPVAPAAVAAGSTLSSFNDVDITSAPASAQSVPRSAAFDASAASAASAAGASPDLAVTVSNPSKQGDGMSAYFTYEVTTKTSLPQYAFGQFTVTRRFRDFDWLHAQLALKFPGAIVPPLPEKHSAQVSTLKVTGVQQSAAWLEDRRAALQRFLHRLVAHPMLHTAADLQAFLEKPDDALEAWKEVSKAPRAVSYQAIATDAKAGLMSAYTKSLSMFGGEAASANFSPVTDVACQQMGNYATALSTQVSAVHKHSKAYIERHKALGTSLTGFSLSLTQLSECEAAINESLSKGFSHMGLCVGRMSATYSEQADREAQTFEEPMKDYIRLLASVKSAITAREAALKAYNGAASSLASKKERLEKLRTSGGKEDKIAALAREVSEGEESVSLTKSEYETIVARVDAEMARFQTEKLTDFKTYVTSFIKLQIEYSERIQASWRELLPRLEEIDSGSAVFHRPTDIA